MKLLKLADNTIDKKDYSVMIDFLKKRRYLNQSTVTKNLKKNFQIF